MLPLLNLRLDEVIPLAIALLIAITVHEAWHAKMADLMGDPTARRLGRVSLNPLVHLDLLGTLMIFIVGFGWGKPVPVNAYNLRGRPLATMALVSAAGPLSNLVMALLVAAPLRLGLLDNMAPLTVDLVPGVLPSPVEMLFVIISLNITLAVFNLLPIPPLDGFGVLMGLLPTRLAYLLARYEQYGPILLLGLISLGYVLRVDILGPVLRPPINLLWRLIVGS